MKIKTQGLPTPLKQLFNTPTASWSASGHSVLARNEGHTHSDKMSLPRNGRTTNHHVKIVSLREVKKLYSWETALIKCCPKQEVIRGKATKQS